VVRRKNVLWKVHHHHRVMAAAIVIIISNISIARRHHLNQLSSMDVIYIPSRSFVLLFCVKSLPVRSLVPRKSLVYFLCHHLAEFLPPNFPQRFQPNALIHF